MQNLNEIISIGGAVALIISGLVVFVIATTTQSPAQKRAQYLRDLEFDQAPDRREYQKLIKKLPKNKRKVTVEKFLEVKKLAAWPIATISRKTGVSTRTVSRIKAARSLHSYLAKIEQERTHARNK